MPQYFLSFIFKLSPVPLTTSNHLSTSIALGKQESLMDSYMDSARTYPSVSLPKFYCPQKMTIHVHHCFPPEILGTARSRGSFLTSTLVLPLSSALSTGLWFTTSLQVTKTTYLLLQASQTSRYTP